MSRTWDIIFVDEPETIPTTTTVTTELSVAGMELCDKQDMSGQLKMVVGPCYMGSKIAHRRLTFSPEEKPKLDYLYEHAGMIELKGENVHLLLEKGT